MSPKALRTWPFDRRTRGRLFVGAALAISTSALAAIGGCSALLDIGQLPIDASVGGDARADVGADRRAPDTGGCTPGCSGTTPYCLEGTCVECKPDSVGCDPAGAPEVCNAGGVWQPAPACGGSTPYCLEGACVQCLPSVEPPSCVADAGLQICDAGITEVIACACANAECQFWPTGTMGDCHYDSGTLTRYAPGFVLDCKSLEIDVGATVAFEPDPDGGSVDAAPQWSVIGVVGSATVDGTIVALVNSLGQDTTAKVTVPSSDGGPGQTFTYTYVQAEGGAGGSTGWACSGAPDASFRVGSGPR